MSSAQTAALIWRRPSGGAQTAASKRTRPISKNYEKMRKLTLFYSVKKLQIIVLMVDVSCIYRSFLKIRNFINEFFVLYTDEDQKSETIVCSCKYDNYELFAHSIDLKKIEIIQISEFEKSVTQSLFLHGW